MRTVYLAARRTWESDPLLTGTALVMLAFLPFAAFGLLFDGRTIDGAAAWMKPAKFAASTAIYSLSLAWVLPLLRDWPRLRLTASRTTAVVMLLEVSIITVQAWRGVASHFNVSTPLDAVLFGVMGAAIAAQTVVAGVVAFALFRQHIPDPTVGTAIRAGMLITVLGASTGGLMTSPTQAQLRAVAATGAMARSGGHTVGAPDGGPGLPAIGWSREHGDLRVPHFVGLHALQVLPVAALWLRRTRRSGRRTMRSVAAGYAAVFLLLLLQALLGQPLLRPGAAVTSLALMSAAAVTASWYLAGRAGRPNAPASNTMGTFA